MLKKQWNGFVEGNWTETVDVRSFIQENYTPYEGDIHPMKGIIAFFRLLLIKLKSYGVIVKSLLMKKSKKVCWT
jgi:Pyruvate-formate lyase